MEKRVDKIKMALEGNQKSFKIFYLHYHQLLSPIFENTLLHSDLFREALNDTLILVLIDYKKNKVEIENWNSIEKIDLKVTTIFKHTLINCHRKIKPSPLKLEIVWKQLSAPNTKVDDWLEKELNSIKLVPKKVFVRGELSPLSSSEIDDHYEIGDISDFDENRAHLVSNLEKVIKVKVNIKSIKRGSP